VGELRKVPLSRGQPIVLASGIVDGCGVAVDDAPGGAPIELASGQTRSNAIASALSEAIGLLDLEQPVGSKEIATIFSKSARLYVTRVSPRRMQVAAMSASAKAHGETTLSAALRRKSEPQRPL
jgi:hypothetical protein